MTLAGGPVGSLQAAQDVARPATAFPQRTGARGGAAEPILTRPGESRQDVPEDDPLAVMS